jgi:hypothetical protein
VLSGRAVCRGVFWIDELGYWTHTKESGGGFACRGKLAAATKGFSGKSVATDLYLSDLHVFSDCSWCCVALRCVALTSRWARIGHRSEINERCDQAVVVESSLPKPIECNCVLQTLQQPIMSGLGASALKLSCALAHHGKQRKSHSQRVCGPGQEHSVSDGGPNISAAHLRPICGVVPSPYRLHAFRRSKRFLLPVPRRLLGAVSLLWRATTHVLTVAVRHKNAALGGATDWRRSKFSPRCVTNDSV